MTRNYPADTQYQDFLTQSYIKEQTARLGWYHQRQQNGPGQSKQFEVFKKKIEAAAPKPTENLLRLKDVKPKSYHKRIITYDDNLLKLAEQARAKSAVADMMPVTPTTREKLYDGFTREGKGRYQYLNSRYFKIPENKYRFPILNSWDHGWRLDDVISKESIKKPDHGRTRIVADTFYTRNGIPVFRREATASF